MTSIVFIGCGAGGLADPHFSSLLAWLDETLPAAPVRRYVLCTHAEAELVRGNSSLTPVIYGDAHSDLPAFLERVCPSTGAVEVVDKNSLALAAITERVRQSTLIDRLLDRDVAHISELLVPPILLPEPPCSSTPQRHRGETG